MEVEVERRRNPRLKAIFEVHCGVLGADQVFLTRDVSAGGVFLTTSDPLPANSEVVLSFRLRPQDPLVSYAGRVVYSQRDAGMGIEFFDLTGELRLTLKQLLDSAH
jgi:hypothetical protein